MPKQTNKHNRNIHKNIWIIANIVSANPSLKRQDSKEGLKKVSKDPKIAKKQKKKMGQIFSNIF